jgi:hypothetical protein
MIAHVYARPVVLHWGLPQIGCLRGFHADPPDADDADDADDDAAAAATSIRTRLGGSKDTTRVSQPPKDSDSI